MSPALRKRGVDLQGTISENASGDANCGEAGPLALTSTGLQNYADTLRERGSRFLINGFNISCLAEFTSS